MSFIHQIPHAHARNERRLIDTLKRLCCKIFLFFYVDKRLLLLMLFDRLLLSCWPDFCISFARSFLILNDSARSIFSAVSLSTSMFANLPVWWFDEQPRHDLAFFPTANIFHELEPRWFRDKSKLFKPKNKLCRRLSHDAQWHLLNANRVQVQRQWAEVEQTHNLSRYRPHEFLINLNIPFTQKIRRISSKSCSPRCINFLGFSNGNAPNSFLSVCERSAAGSLIRKSIVPNIFQSTSRCAKNKNKTWQKPISTTFNFTARIMV